jgi:2-dehydro-3-deoxy-D-arabinonate dehydratase
MRLTRYRISAGYRWALDGAFLPEGLDLNKLLKNKRDRMLMMLDSSGGGMPVSGKLAAPIDPTQEVWAAGVTYQRSREARREESATGDLYDHVYDAARPELFFKSLGWRVTGSGDPIRVRADSGWNVPEPELVLVINSHSEIVGYCAGNDVSSRDIEGANPLYLPQAKVYDGSCALGEGIYLCPAEEIVDVPIWMVVRREGQILYDEWASTASLKRGLKELVDYLTRELEFPQGVFLMTGTCLVPGGDFNLQPGDQVDIRVGGVRLENRVES